MPIKRRSIAANLAKNNWFVPALDVDRAKEEVGTGGKVGS
jgi:hypothetical protein